MFFIFGRILQRLFKKVTRGRPRATPATSFLRIHMQNYQALTAFAPCKPFCAFKNISDGNQDHGHTRGRGADLTFPNTEFAVGGALV
jgi:hypothetical protein